MKAKKPLPEIMEELYLTAYSRLPTPEELKRTLPKIEKAENKQQALEDVMWAILNTREFMFNR